MAFGKTEKATYLSVKKGLMVGGKKDKDGKSPIEANWCEGRALGITIKDGTFNNRPTKEFQLSMVDDNGERFILCFTARALFAKGFFSGIRGVDLRRPFKIHTWGSKENDKISFCSLEQDGKRIEQDPKLKEIKIVDNDWSKAAPLMFDAYTWMQGQIAQASFPAHAPSATDDQEEEARHAGVTDEGVPEPPHPAAAGVDVNPPLPAGNPDDLPF